MESGGEPLENLEVFHLEPLLLLPFPKYNASRSGRLARRTGQESLVDAAARLYAGMERLSGELEAPNVATLRC